MSISLRFNSYGHSRSFRSLSDFARFATKQAEQLGKFDGDGSENFRVWASKMQSNWRTAAQHARTNSHDPDEVQRVLMNHPVIPAESEIARHLQVMVEQDRANEAGEFFNFLSRARARTNAANVRASELAAHGEFASIIALASKSKQQQTTSFRSIVEEHEARLGEMLEADRQEIEEKREQFATMVEDASTHLEGLSGRVAKQIADHSAEWLETHDAFVKQLQTETAVKLWADRADTHTKRYKSFRAWSVGFGIVGLLLVIGWIFGGFAVAKWAFPDDATGRVASYTAGSLAFFTLFVWGQRVLVRSMISEDHLATDASARSALAHTYLALTKEEAATKEDRAIILATLFAPVSDGLVKDDGMPTMSPTALAAQMITKS